MVENGEFTWPWPFWRQPLRRWDSMFQAGVRAHYAASRLAAQTMVRQQRGLIVNISFWSAQKRIGNVAYGVAKAATDKMTADMAHERLRVAVARGTKWLIEKVESGEWTTPSPIGFYFAKLWYYERLYPMIFTVGALKRAVRCLRGND